MLGRDCQAHRREFMAGQHRLRRRRFSVSISHFSRKYRIVTSGVQCGISAESAAVNSSTTAWVAACLRRFVGAPSGSVAAAVVGLAGVAHRKARDRAETCGCDGAGSIYCVGGHKSQESSARSHVTCATATSPIGRVVVRVRSRVRVELLFYVLSSTDASLRSECHTSWLGMHFAGHFASRAHGRPVSADNEGLPKLLSGTFNGAETVEPEKHAVVCEVPRHTMVCVSFGRKARPDETVRDETVCVCR